MRRIRSRPKRLVMDGSPLTAGHFSGIGHYTLSLFQALDEVLAERARPRGPPGRAPRPDPHMGTFGFRRIRPLPFPVPMSNVTLRRLVAEGRLPRMDLLLGRGTYFFPNYARWPLAWSPSITAVHDLSFEKVPELVDGPNGEAPAGGGAQQRRALRPHQRPHLHHGRRDRRALRDRPGPGRTWWAARPTPATSTGGRTGRSPR